MKATVRFGIASWIWLSTVLVISCAAPSITRADSLTVYAETNLCSSSQHTVTSGSATASSACPVDLSGGSGQTAEAAGDLSTGTFGAKATASTTNLYTTSIPDATVQLDYDFTITGVSNGTLDVGVAFQGLVSGECFVCTYYSPLARFGVSLNEGVVGQQLMFISSVEQVVNLPSGASSFVATTPIVNGNANFFVTLEAGLQCRAIMNTDNLLVPCDSTSDFLDPASITGANAFDSNGNLVSDATIVSESGFNPNAGTPVTAPEPSSLLLLGSGLLALIGASKAWVLRQS
jgi:hypothetical protein